MGFVQIVDNLVAHKWEQGEVVAEEHFAELERLVGLGAVRRVPKKDVPEDAVPAPEKVEPEPDAKVEPEPATPEPAKVEVVTATTD